MKSLLSAKNRRMSPEAQVQSLVRIARRAICGAEWQESFLTNPAAHYQSAEEQSRIRTESFRLRAKAAQATREMCQIVVDHPEGHWNPAQRRAATQYVEEEKAEANS